MFYPGHQASEGNASLVSQTRTEGFGEEVQKRILLGNFALNAE